MKVQNLKKANLKAENWYIIRISTEKRKGKREDREHYTVSLYAFLYMGIAIATKYILMDNMKGVVIRRDIYSEVTPCYISLTASLRMLRSSWWRETAIEEKSLKHWDRSRYCKTLNIWTPDQMNQMIHWMFSMSSQRLNSIGSNTAYNAF